MITTASFTQLGLAPDLLLSLAELGYETPTPIQEQSIPLLMADRDVLAQAQTGTGKTAAFALPILSQVVLATKQPQALILAPTRELAIQVAEAFQSYAKHLKGFHVVPIFGGQDYQIQLRAIKRGAHVIVGTPGRLMDHLRRGTLSMTGLKTVVLDEADEMLKMGFIEDIQWILSQLPHDHQTALFSATLPPAVQQIAKRYLKEPKKIHIEPKASTVEATEQLVIRVSNNQKLEVLTRFLEVEDIQAAIIFVRTKNSSSELTEKLQARGFAVAALNGDMSQSSREKVISQIKRGSLDLIVATDVAARGIDVERISHVINFDIPHDVESYIHRIGRTGRAGRKGKALLLMTPREQRLLNDIERAIHKPIKPIEPPSLKAMTEKRSKQLAEKVIHILQKGHPLQPYHEMVASIMEQGSCDSKEVAAALVYLMQPAHPIPSREIKTAEPEAEKRRSRHRPHGKKKRFSRDSQPPSGKRKAGKPKSSNARFRHKYKD